MMNFSGTTAIVGIGATEFSKDSGRTPLALAVEACQAALDDAGVAAEQVNGIVTFSAEMNTEIEVARNLGIPNLTHFSMIHHGGGAACGTIAQAAMAVASGQADYVLVYRAFNERSWARFGAGVQDRPAGAEVAEVSFSWSSPFGLLTPASWVAMFATRYMHEYGATSEDFGRVAVADRKHAATNPKAHFYQRPITLEDHQNSRWIMYPLHLLDCCQESDGGQALLVTTMERARDLRQKPAKIAAAAQGSAAGQMHRLWPRRLPAYPCVEPAVDHLERRKHSPTSPPAPGLPSPPDPPGPAPARTRTPPHARLDHVRRRQRRPLQEQVRVQNVTVGHLQRLRLPAPLPLHRREFLPDHPPPRGDLQRQPGLPHGIGLLPRKRPVARAEQF